MKAAIQFVLRGYKRWISPMLPHACRFVPTCSEYAMEAIELYGFLRGSWLAVTRLLRCHPLARAGYDPVPTQTHRVTHCCDYLASAPAGANPKSLNRH